MSTTRQWVIVIAVITALGGGLFAATRIFGDELFPVTVGSRAPKFEASTIDAAPRKKSIEDYRGEVVLLNVWATWCGPCRVEMPSMQALYRDFGPRGLKIVAISIDDEGAEKKIRDFAQEYGLTFEILFDPTGGIQRAYQTSGVPETFIIGRDGVIRNRHIGLSDWNSESTRALVDRLLAEPRS
jgi:cytochrome c biogenesis protein CcmG, thiol:disulfide interchange protein DsbE